MINWHRTVGRINQSFRRGMELVIVLLKSLPISILIGVLVWFILSKLESKYESIVRKKKVATGLAFYVTLLLQMGILSRPLGSERGVEWILFMKAGGYYLVILFSLANIIIFIPFGMLVPKVFDKVKTWWKVALVACGFSIFVELVQFALGCGVSEVEDVIMNTLGGVIGYFILKVIQKKRNKI